METQLGSQEPEEEWAAGAGQEEGGSWRPESHMQRVERASRHLGREPEQYLKDEFLG